MKTAILYAHPFTICLHARIPEFASGGGGGLGQPKKKALTTFFFFVFVFSPQLILQKSNG